MWTSLGAKDLGEKVLSKKQRKTRLLHSPVGSCQQSRTIMNGFVGRGFSGGDVNKVRPWGEKNVHHWEDEVGPEVVVDLSDPPSKAGRVTKPGLKVVPNTLSDHYHLMAVRVYHNHQIQYLQLTKNKRSNTARAIRRLLKLLLKLRLKKLALNIFSLILYF